MAASLGNGVVDYNTAATDAKKKLVANGLKLNTDQNYVQSEQQRALQVIAQRQAQGLDVTGQQKYLNNQLGYKAPTAPTTPTPALSTNPSVNPAAAAAPKPDLKSMMLQIAQKQQTPFSYDPNSDPAYQAALKRTQANIGTGTSQAQAEMNRRGILNSTITSDRMGEINASEMSNLESTIVPQLMQSAYQKYADQIQQEQQQFNNYGTLDTAFTNEDQRAIDNNFAESDRLGYYTPEEAKPIIKAIVALKQQAESQGITAADRAKLSAQADGYRAQLLAMGVDPKAYGSSVNAKTASATPGIRTLQGQQLDSSNQAQQFNQAQTTKEFEFQKTQANEQFAYKKARDAISDTQWQAQFDESVKQNGLSYALQVLGENNQTAYQQAQLALSEDDNSRAWATLDYEMSQPSAAAKGLTSNQILDSMKSLYTEDVMSAKDPRFPDLKTKTGTRITADPAKRKEMFQQVVDAGKSDAETDQILNSLGMTKAEIEKFTKEYSGNA